ncbi:ATP-dependent DNA helicase [Mycena venus]|uniref:ATP-dependent DNA helicase n=1 Tax=Mycena venus TaxID=2733690 RepID=A0A8H7CG49_9AGAR|nr:ATP-dependent DNA helicase [Mycena venus]
MDIDSDGDICSIAIVEQLSAEDERQHRREIQRIRRANQDENTADLLRKKDGAARSAASKDAREQSRNQGNLWWDRVALLNSAQSAEPIRLRWNRKCKWCGIQGLTGERLHDKCFICGPKRTHYQPPLPPYPEEWEVFINDRKTASISRKLNNIFTLTALGVHDGDFMKFSPGVAAVTLAGGRTYHRILPANEGQHAIRWFIHDPSAIFVKGTELDIPQTWVQATLAGLERVNPFIAKLQNLSTANDENIVLEVEHTDSITNEIAAIISLAPASLPTRRKVVIQRKGNDKPIFLDILSPLVEPMHYLLLLPHGTSGWSMDSKTTTGKKYSQARWYRTRFYMNAEQMSTFSRLTGEWLVDAWSMVEEARLTYIRNNQQSDPDEEEFMGTGDEEPVDDIRLPSTFIHSLTGLVCCERL